MKARSLRTLLALLLIGIMVPAGLLTAPPRAHAVAGIEDTVHDFITEIESTISAVANPTTAASTYWTMLKGSVLDPLARMLAQAILKAVTASIVDSINGKNGSPQFVKNLPSNLQKVGDQVGLSFITKFGSSINSPFSASITNALHSNYLQQTSLAGFFAANQCTLSTYTGSNANTLAFVGGNFNQGGLPAWFALTTQENNNPMLLYLNGKRMLNSTVASAQTNQKQTIQQSNGFLSWCSSGPQDPPNIGATCSDFAEGSDCSGTEVCVQTPGKTTGTCRAPTAATSDATPSTCYSKDGTPGNVETPGSVLHDSLSKAVGSPIDDLISVHDFDQAVDTIFAALVTKVVSSGLSALSSSGSTSATSTSYTSQLTTSTDPNAAAVGSTIFTTAQTTLNQLGTYVSQWQTIQTSAQTAANNLQTLVAGCPAQASAAQTALATEVTPILTQSQAAFNTASTTQALALKVQAESNSTSAGSVGSLTADVQALAAAPPSTTDYATAQTNSVATSPSNASSTPSGSLNVSGGTMVDNMTLISQNAAQLRTTCGTQSSSVPTI